MIGVEKKDFAGARARARARIETKFFEPTPWEKNKTKLGCDLDYWKSSLANLSLKTT
jgi:hypothetical protein